MDLEIGLIQKIVDGKWLNKQVDQYKAIKIKGVAIDSRLVQPGDLFMALPGERTDGHLFLESAFVRGAVAAIVAKDVNMKTDKVLLQVDNVAEALQRLAKHNRSTFNIPVVAVTGSSGKTTTKDMVAAVLQEKWPILKTEGNFNNELGLPLTLLQLNDTYQGAVVEMGMRGLGQISKLVDIAKPDMGIITNVGYSHIEILENRDNIATAKGELLEGLPHGGTAIINGEDEYAHILGQKFSGKKIYYGFNRHCHIVAEEIKMDDFSSEFKVKYHGGSFYVKLPLPGKFNVLNALAAVAVAFELGLSKEQIQTGLTKIKLTKMRLEKTKGKKGEVIINDAYNANPDSMKAALEILHNLQGGKKIAVLGEMYELGHYTATAYGEIGKIASQLNIDYLITVGGSTKLIVENAVKEGFNMNKGIHVATNEEAAKYVETIVAKDDIVLVKGSRGMNMEQIVNKLKQFKENSGG